MHLDGLDVFVEVVEARSFVRAAERLRMPPTTVSAKIARIEQALGVTLIRRTTRRFHLTEEGEGYYQSCSLAIRTLREAEARLKSVISEPSGTLRVTASANIAQSVLPPIIERFTTLYPNVSVDVIVTNRVVDLLAEGVDIALRIGRLDDSRLVARKLFATRLCLWASREYLDRNGTPRNVEQLARHPFIGFSPWLRSPPVLRAGRRTFQVPSACRISCDDIGTLQSYVARGAGIGVLGEEEARQAGLIPVLPQFGTGTGTVSLVYPAQKFLSTGVRAFIAIATQSPRAKAP